MWIHFPAGTEQTVFSYHRTIRCNRIQPPKKPYDLVLKHKHPKCSVGDRTGCHWPVVVARSIFLNERGQSPALLELNLLTWLVNKMTVTRNVCFFLIYEQLGDCSLFSFFLLFFHFKAVENVGSKQWDWNIEQWLSNSAVCSVCR